MKTNKAKGIIVPRNFLLIDYMDRVKEYNCITYGLIEEDEKEYADNFRTFEHWNGTFLYETQLAKVKKPGKKTDEEEEPISILPFTFKCTQKFPEEGPIIKFAPDSLEYACVHRNCTSEGLLNEELMKKIPWSEDYSIGEYLMKLRRIFV